MNSSIGRGRAAATIMIVASSLCLAGCGSGMNDATFNVSGAVTYGGEPVPSGTVKFIPADGGTVGFAKIKDGRYDTAGDKKARGVEQGIYTIRVIGFDGVPIADDADEGEMLPNGRSLFPQYSTEREFSGNDTFDIVIPGPGGTN